MPPTRYQLDFLFLPPSEGQPIEVCFARRVILHAHAADYLNHGCWQRLEHRELLRALHSRVRFRFDGYLDDPRGIEQISELRSFLQDGHRAGLAWGFFADLFEEIPRRMRLSRFRRQSAR